MRPPGRGGGLAETEAALAADGARPRVTLCAVPGLADPAELVAGGAEPARWSPFGAYLEGGDPAAIAAVGEGRAAVQDEASQLAALALARVDGDAARTAAGSTCAPGRAARRGCSPGWPRGAAPGCSPPTPRLHRARLAACAAAGHRRQPRRWPPTGPRPAGGRGRSTGCSPTCPCSGLGALRRRPEARWRRSPATSRRSAACSARLLAAALDAARPGGVVAYVTCSPHLAETRAVVADVLRRRDDVEVLDAPAVLAEVPGLRCPEPDGRYAQFWPHRHGTDAIFLALLRRAPPAARTAAPAIQARARPAGAARCRRRGR